MFASLVGARDDVFTLIAGRQQPQHTMHLYKVAGTMCALLAHATADLGHGHAATTHARTALHCAEMSGYTPLRVYIRWVQSNVAYWDGRYDDAAHRELGGTEHWDTAVDWAVTAVDEFTAEPQPHAQFIAAARIDLARAHLARGDLDAVHEHLIPVLRSTVTDHRTVPVISRARSLHTLISARPDVTTSTVASLRDDLAQFCTHPAATPAGLEPGPTD